ncbi:hypothetical protein PMAYCL1PPCAC_26477, partial [Pristionchus mayeri]
WSIVHVTKILKSNPQILPSHDVVNVVCRMLARRKEYLISELIDIGLVSFLVQGLSIDEERMQNRCARVLFKIVKGWDDA